MLNTCEIYFKMINSKQCRFVIVFITFNFRLPKLNLQVAGLCSHIVNSKIPSLNPEILFWWFIQYYPEINEFINQYGSFDCNGDTHLFDACVSNPYIEAVPICSEYLSRVLQLIS